MRRHWCVLSAVLLGMLATSARAADPDLSSPKAALRSFFAAMDKGDTAMLEKTVLFSKEADKQKEEKDILGAMTDMVVAMNKLADAATAKFGPGGKEIVADHPTQDATKRLEEAEVKIDEKAGTATVAIKNQAEPTNLRKVGEQWKVDLAAMPQRDMAARAIPFLRGMARAAATTADEISNGSFKTVAEAKTALGERMRTAVEGAEPPASRPSSAPASQP